MLAFLLAPVYIAVNVYVLRWMFRFIQACFRRFYSKWIRAVAAVLYLLICLTPLLAFLFPESGLKTFAARIGNGWLGIFLYLVLLIAALDLIRVCARRIPVIKKRIQQPEKWLAAAGWAVILAVAGISLYGSSNAGNIRITKYSVSIPSESLSGQKLKIVLAADLHLGYSIGYEHVKQMVDKINDLEPDLVCLAGDIFDNRYESIGEPERIAEELSRIDSRYGVYACYGNHDYEEEILAGFTFDSGQKVQIGDKMRELLRDAGIRTLEDEAVLINDSFYLAGRRDYSSEKKSGKTRKSPQELVQGLDPEKPLIVMDHQPRELQELADAGVDLDLCGHTHDGQLFPANIVTGLIWENAYGHQKTGDMDHIVTSGAGIFGPYMRVGTKSEIVKISVEFE